MSANVIGPASMAAENPAEKRVVRLQGRQGRAGV